MSIPARFPGFRFFLALLAGALLLAPAASGQFGDSNSLFGGGTDDAPAVTVRAEASRATLRPGDQLTIAVVMDFKEGWHAWPSADQDVLPGGFDWAIRTSAALSEVPGWIQTAGSVQWPEPHLAAVADISGGGGTIEVPTYSDTAIAYLPVLISNTAAPGEHTLTVEVTYQACDESVCLPPEFATMDVTVTIDPEATSEDASEVFSGFDASVFADLSAGTTPTTSASPRMFFGYALPSADGALGVLITAILAALGGFVLNLTPCVLPVIPIKIMAISQHAGTPGKSFMLGMWMSFGVIAFWVGIGLPVALLANFADPSRLFGIWWVTLGIGLIIAVMGVGIMGLFTINLPQKVYLVNPKADTAGGSFVFGIMTAVLGLPCFGFVAGALLAGSATMPPALIMTIFTSLGIGMALPYFVLSAKPSLLDSIPRTGPASELVKQVMGLLLLAAAAYFAGAGALGFISERPSLAASMPWWGKVVHWWGVAFFAGGAGVWMIVRTFGITKKPARRVVFSTIALVLGGSAVLFTIDTTRKASEHFWIPFEQAGLDAALESGQVVVLDFTAEWCLNCKVLEATVLSVEPVKGELLSAGVTPMIVDLTSSKAPGWDKLHSLGRTGIPTLVVYGPGLPEPWIANNYTSDQVMTAIEHARGEIAAAD